MGLNFVIRVKIAFKYKLLSSIEVFKGCFNQYNCDFAYVSSELLKM